MMRRGWGAALMPIAERGDTCPGPCLRLEEARACSGRPVLRNRHAKSEERSSVTPHILAVALRRLC